MNKISLHIKKQAGLSVLEVLIGLAILALASIPMIAQINDTSDLVKNRVAAEQLTLISNAAASYVKANNATLSATATTTTPVATTIATLVAGGYLNAGFNATNSYGQTACLLTLKNAGGLLQSVVVTESGVAIPLKYLYAIAALVGARGGGIEASAMNGSYGAWTLPVGNYANANCSGTAVTDNHLAALVTLDGTTSAAVADYLYRFAVPGFPDANRMYTSVDINNNNVNNVNDVVAKRFVDAADNTFLLVPSGTSNLSTVNIVDGKVSARSASVKLSSMLGQYVHKANYIQAQNTTVPQPICPDSGTPNIDVIPQRALSTDGYQVPAPINNGSSWTVVILDSSSTQIPGATFLARTYCYYP